MGDALGSHGTLVKFNGTTVAELVDIDGPTLVRNVHEAPRQQSDWVQKVPGMANGGTLSMTVNLIPTNGTHTAVKDLLSTPLNGTALYDWQIIFPDAAATTWTLPAILQEFSPSAPVDGILQASITIEIADEPTL